LIYILPLYLFLHFAGSCEKDNDETNSTIPVLTTAEVIYIKSTIAESGGNITSDGGATVTARSVCWSTAQTPSISDSKTEDDSGGGNFTSSITDLEPYTTYYVRAYATNSIGTGYGDVMSFTTIGNFTDQRDGKVYQIVTIGNQEWMAENLVYSPTSGNYWAYDNNRENIAICGYLYDWQTAQNVCPAGWHLPSNEEWTHFLVLVQ
jgi:hypothetical protein